MKRVLLFCLLVLLGTTSCQTAADDNKARLPQTSSTDSLINFSGASVPESFRSGARLVAANDCLTCHSLDKKMVGPAYRDIARRYHAYEGNVDNLASAIVTGSRGIWGQQAMTPHPNVTHADALEMVRYIFSLDTNVRSNTVHGGAMQ